MNSYGKTLKKNYRHTPNQETTSDYWHLWIWRVRKIKPGPKGQVPKENKITGNTSRLTKSPIGIIKRLAGRPVKSICKNTGAADKYNKTLTIAAIRAVHHCMQSSDASEFSDFIEQVPRLKNSFKHLMACHYKKYIFNNAIAKRAYIAPDILPF